MGARATMGPETERSENGRNHGHHCDVGLRFRRLRFRAEDGGGSGHSVPQLQRRAQPHARRDYRALEGRRRGHHLLRALHGRGVRCTTVVEGGVEDGHGCGQHRCGRCHGQRYHRVQRGGLRHRGGERPRAGTHACGLAAHQRDRRRYEGRRVGLPSPAPLGPGARPHLRPRGLRTHRSGGGAQGSRPRIQRGGVGP